jgi:hypothetical protein
MSREERDTIPESMAIHLMSITSKVITSSLAYHGEQSI